MRNAVLSNRLKKQRLNVANREHDNFMYKLITNKNLKHFMKLSYINIFRTFSLVSTIGCSVAAYFDNNISAALGWIIASGLYVNVLYVEYLIREYRKQAEEHCAECESYKRTISLYKVGFFSPNKLDKN